MIFESMWPLAFLLAVPVVVILYLLKPKGTDMRIPSVLLWEKWFRNQQSKTFLEKFIHNILMYMQIVILLLLVLALMSPYLRRPGSSGEPVVFVFDTSASMQHDAGNGQTRLEEAVERAKEQIASSEGTAFSVVTSDCLGTNLLAVGLTDADSLYAVLEEITCCDGPGDLQAAESVVETICRNAEEVQTAQVIVFTDGIGAEEAMSLSRYFDAQLLVMGDPVSNVANNFLSYTEADSDEEDFEAGERSAEAGRRIRCASSLTNYSDTRATMEISLYAGAQLVAVRQAALEAGETVLVFFDEFAWEGEALRSELGSIRFGESGAQDSLPGDNIAYAVLDETSPVDAVLVGDGNTYIEKAYQAVTGESLPRVREDGESGGGQQTVRIYDAGMDGSPADGVNTIVFRGSRNVSGAAENVLLTVLDCELTAGLSSFAIGVNETNLYEVPDWGTGFLWAGEQCAGYYGEHDGVKEVVVGFDIRESDFPLKAEFPVFLSHAVHFLSDSSLLAETIYMAGDTVLFHPQAGFDVGLLAVSTRKAGLYEVRPEDVLSQTGGAALYSGADDSGQQPDADGGGRPFDADDSGQHFGTDGSLAAAEQYVVRFATASQSDGRITAESVAFGGASEDIAGNLLVKKQLRSILLAVALVLLAVEWFLYRRQTRSANRFYLGVRVVTAALLLMALFGVSVRRQDQVNTTIFLVDLSNSNGQNRQAMEDYLDHALQAMPEQNRYGIVIFGKDALVEQFLTEEDSFSGILSLPDKTATNFETAMSRALSMIPSGSAGRVVFLTDGKETKGELANTAPALLSGQVELLAVLFDTEQGADAYVEKVELPAYLYQGDAYTMTVTVESNYETDAELQVFMGSVQTQAYEVHLRRGTNRFQFRQTVTGEYVESFEVRVAAAGDTCLENDSYHAYAAVDAPPRVLLVCGRGEDSSSYEEVLRSANCNYETVSAVNAPATLADMLEFRSILLENVYLSDLPDGFLGSLETYVKDYGCGLVCLGGEDSYALGGYRESVLETVLPVDMELRGVDQVPVTAMIMVIDHSGSMSMEVGGGATSLDLAVTAAKTAVDQMRSTDYVGVLAFDDRYSWIVEPMLASDKEAIKEQIETIAEGGGTTIQPALQAALAGVNECAADLRHVVLLTDGQGESSDYQKIIDAYNNTRVTLSTVAVGDGSDARLLERLADSCGGRYYYSDIAADIPKIFAQEVFLSGDTYLQNGAFRLAVNGGSEITQGLFEDGWPAIYGYVSATPKHASQVLIVSEKDDPVLSIMQYGLGHTVAWNSDVSNQWTAGYAGQSDYVQLWKRIVDYSVGNAAIGEDFVDVMTAGGTTSLVYQAADYDEQTRVEAVYTDPEGNTWTEPLPATAPGRYEARLSTDLTGIYQLSVRRMDGTEVTGTMTTAAAVQYADEYKFGVSTAAFTGFVERYGSLIDPETDFWQNRENTSEERYDLTKWLLALAILWFVVDIAVRRFCFRPQDTGWYRRAEAGLKGRRERSREIAEEPQKAGGNLTGKPVEEVPEASREGEEKSVQTDGRSEGKAAGVRRKKEARPAQQTLDTSALLKKKDQRNQLK